MKKNIYVFILTAFFIAGGITSCSLIDKDPVSQIEPDNFFQNTKDTNAWMAGIYHSLQTTLNGNYFNWGEARADNLTFAAPGGNTQTDLLRNNLTPDDPDINPVTNWENLYRTIGLCNVVIEKFPDLIAKNVGGGISTYKDQLGQAYALRALMYFYTLRSWGGTPIVPEAITTLTQKIEYPRATPQEMKAQILSDIEKSLANIGAVATTKFYIQKGAVYALKTDVHMWFQEYNEAIAAANNVTGYSYISNPALWKGIFIAPESSSEMMFALYWDAVERGGGSSLCANLASSSNTSGWAVAASTVAPFYSRVVNNRLVDARLYQSLDTVVNRTLAAYQATFVGNATPKFHKFSPVNPQTNAFAPQGNNDCSVKIPIYRFADVQLLKAEALARTYSFQPALDILNAIRSRVGYTVQARLTDYNAFATNEQKAIAIQRTILDERKLEFIGEGKRWFDLARVGTIYDFTNGYEYLREVMNPILASRGAQQFEGVNIGRVLLPLNAAVINANTLLRGAQNPPYTQ